MAWTRLPRLYVYLVSSHTTSESYRPERCIEPSAFSALTPPPSPHTHAFDYFTLTSLIDFVNFFAFLPFFLTVCVVLSQQRPVGSKGSRGARSTRGGKGNAPGRRASAGRGRGRVRPQGIAGGARISHPVILRERVLVWDTVEKRSVCLVLQFYIS